MNQNCVIYSENIESSKRLFNGMAGKKNLAFVLHLFTDRLSLEAFIKDNEDSTIILDEESYYDNLMRMFSGKVIVLTEEVYSKDIVKDKFGETVVDIYRYQPFEKIYRQIIDDGELAFKSKLVNVELIGIYSPVEVEPREIFALNLAKLLGQRKRVLYINLRAFSGLWDLLPQAEGGCLSDAIYYYRQNGKLFTDKIKSVIASVEGFDYFAPIRCAKDISYMDATNIMPFVETVARECGYEQVILDIGTETGNWWMFIENCDAVYMPIKNDYIGIRKVSEFESYYCQSGMEEVIGKIVKVRLPEGEECRADYWSRLTVGGMYRYVKALLEQREENVGGGNRNC